MIKTEVLLPIVLGLGVAVMSSPQLTRLGADKSSASVTHFVLAIQMLGFAVFGVALYYPLHALAHGHSGLSGQSLREEDCLIAALALLFVVMAIRNALRSYMALDDRPGWQIGLFDRLTPVIMFAVGMCPICLWALLVTIGIASAGGISGAGRAIAAVFAILLLGTGIVIGTLRLLAKTGVLTDVSMCSRGEQQKVIAALAGADGTWVPVVVRAAVEVAPVETFSTCVWVASGKWYWRIEDGWTLARFQDWAANHAVVPVPELHMKRLSVWGGKGSLSSMRGTRLTDATTRFRRLDTWRAHRRCPAPPEDGPGPERAAGLVFISRQDLKDAGLAVDFDVVSVDGGEVGRPGEDEPRAITGFITPYTRM